MKKIGIVVQRYGLEVNGGAEYHARVLAEKLIAKYDVEILTTCAIDYNAWDNHYKLSDNLVNNVPVRRFTTIPKNHKSFRKSRRVILKNTKLQQLLKKIRVHSFLDHKLNLFNPNQKDCNNWLEKQGPYCPDLISHINQNNQQYDCYIFFTYLYYPTAIGMKEVANKSIFIPTAHDEPLFYTKPYENIFSIPKFIMFNTVSEKELVAKNYPNFTKNYDISGVGIELNLNFDFSNVENKYNYNFDYLLYIGRIEGSKGCDELIDFYNKSNFSKHLKLVFVGKTFFDVAPTKNIIFTGFVDEVTKYYLLNNCKALIIPSKYESLSLVTLEAMIQKKIVIANGNCEVLKNHIQDSHAGYTYTNHASFEETINKLQNLSASKEKELGKNGYDYVSSNYTWEVILKKFDKAISYITTNTTP